MLHLFINSYLKGLTVDKAILVSKQFCIDFSYEEMRLALPYLKKNYHALLNENSKIYTLSNLANCTLFIKEHSYSLQLSVFQKDF